MNYLFTQKQNKENPAERNRDTDGSGTPKINNKSHTKKLARVGGRICSATENGEENKI